MLGLVSTYDSFQRNLFEIYVYMVFATEEILEVAIESWPEWRLNITLPNSIQTL